MWSKMGLVCPGRELGFYPKPLESFQLWRHRGRAVLPKVLVGVVGGPGQRQPGLGSVGPRQQEDDKARRQQLGLENSGVRRGRKGGTQMLLPCLVWGPGGTFPEAGTWREQVWEVLARSALSTSHGGAVTPRGHWTSHGSTS